MPCDGQLLVADGGDGIRITDEREDRLADVADDAVREDWLVLAGLVDAERPGAGDVGRGDRAEDARTARLARRRAHRS